MYGFYIGRIFDAYEYLGCCYATGGTTFRTFAPAAEKISVIGDFNAWQETEMQQVYDGNFWECTIQTVKPGERYKYRIYEKGGKVLDHADPYGYGMELRPNTASIVRDMSTFHFTDSKWMRNRTDRKKEPLKELMELVWNNLISNAIKFTPEGGNIVLEAYCKMDRIIVRIQDTGCGMSRETQKHIFDKFYQGNPNHSQEGNGLGLALVWRIILMSSGSITVSSKESEGSCFEIILPK